MRVLLLEDNLMWSARLRNSLTKLGHEVVTVDPEIAIVNLGSDDFMSRVPELKAQNVVTLAHAGHKEKDLHELGRRAGCDLLATNSELTFKIESLLSKAASLIGTPQI